jgi:hypothetical protein
MTLWRRKVHLGAVEAHFWHPGGSLWCPGGSPWHNGGSRVTMKSQYDAVEALQPHGGSL